MLQEEIAGRLGKATNQNLYIVSLLTAIFLPITLITGIFGMNVGGLPGVDQDTGFVWVIGLMILTVVTSLVLLHWRRFLQLGVVAASPESVGLPPFLNFFAEGAVSLGDGKFCGIRKDGHSMQSHLFYLDRERNDRL